MPRHLLAETGWPPSVIRVVCAVPVVTAIGVIVQHGASPEALLLSTAAAAPWVLLAFGRFVPWPVAVTIELVATTLLLTKPQPFDVAPFFLVFTVGVFAAVEPARASVGVLAVSVALMVAVELTGHFSGVAIWALGMAMGWLGGFALQAQEAAHAAATDRAATEERQRIARELHDVVAHSLAVTMLHLTGARLALGRDPAEAEAALLQAEESGRQSMADIRRAIGVLGIAESHQPMPGIIDVEQLVNDFSSAGLPGELHVEGDLSAVPPAVGLAAYRIVQESMTNAAKHAPKAEVRVEVTVGSEAVRLSVRNPRDPGAPVSRSGGLGIAGMGQRASLAGGTLQAGPEGDDWSVVASLPLGPVQ